MSVGPTVARGAVPRGEAVGRGGGQGEVERPAAHARQAAEADVQKAQEAAPRRDRP